MSGEPIEIEKRSNVYVLDPDSDFDPEKTVLK